MAHADAPEPLRGAPGRLFRALPRRSVLALLLAVACLGTVSAIHTVEQAAEIKAILAAMAQAPETNYG